MGDIHIHKHVQMQTYVYKCTDMHTMGSLMVHAFSLLNPEQKATHFLCVYLTGVELEHVQINFYKPRIASLNECCRKDRKLTVDLGVVDQKALQRFHLATNVYFSMTYCQIQQISRVLYALLLQVTSIDIVCPKIILQISTVWNQAETLRASCQALSVHVGSEPSDACQCDWRLPNLFIQLDFLGFNKHCYVQGGYGNMERLSR